MSTYDPHCSFRRRGLLGMYPMRLWALIVWNGGAPLPPLEDAILPIAVRDLDPLVKQLKAPADLVTVKQVFSSPLTNPLPPGWAYVGEYDRTPHIHLRYMGCGLNGTPFEGWEPDVFLCIATSAKDEPDARRVLYIRDMPFDATDGRFAQNPFNRDAAWLTLYVRGESRIITSWKASHKVEGYLTLEGEVSGTALA